MHLKQQGNHRGRSYIQIVGKCHCRNRKETNGNRRPRDRDRAKSARFNRVPITLPRNAEQREETLAKFGRPAEVEETLLPVQLAKE